MMDKSQHVANNIDDYFKMFLSSYLKKKNVSWIRVTLCVCFVDR